MITERQRDLALYGAIGALSAAQTMVGTGIIPKEWVIPIGLANGAAIAIKAKLSNNAPKEENNALPAN